MKLLITLVAILGAFSCCSASCSKDGSSTASQNNENGNNNMSAPHMKITIGKAVFTATLYDNPSAHAFKAMLPMTIDMNELNGNEKYDDLPNTLPAKPAVGGDLKAGDLALYGNKVLVFFYKNFHTSYSYTKLGSVDHPSGLAAALGAGNIVVKFEKN
ncbi:cyclophilin-like fold protein [Sphingobacterium sp. KU25419]|jgi:hypothetical protein|nr:cyclophilin-like fold protein [Sphingobacterium sp. KU25419]